MTAPNGNGGWVQLPGGYQPNGQVQPQQMQQPQAQMQQQPQQQMPHVSPMQWVPPGPIGAPPEGMPPYYPPNPQAYQPVAPPMVRFGAQQPPVQQQQVPQQQAPMGVDLNSRLTGANIPQELQGRTLAEAMTIYNGMRNVVLQTVPGPQAQQPVVQQQAPVQGQPQAPAFDWRNPEEGIRRAVRGEIQQAVAPMLQQTQNTQIENARRTAATEFGAAWLQLEPQIIAKLQGADPAALTNPLMWKTAAESVLGADVLRLARQGGAQQPQAGFQTSQPMMQPSLQQPAPNLNGFFTEQPTVGGPTGGARQLSPQEQWAAQQMGMDVATYAAWAGSGPRRA